MYVSQLNKLCKSVLFGLLVFAISLLCNYFKVAAVLRKRYREHLVGIFWCSIQKKYHPKSAN